MVKKDASLDFRLKKIDVTRNYLLGDIKHNCLMSEKHEKACKTLNYFEYLFAFISAASRCVSFLHLCDQ